MNEATFIRMAQSIVVALILFTAALVLSKVAGWSFTTSMAYTAICFVSSSIVYNSELANRIKRLENENRK